MENVYMYLRVSTRSQTEKYGLDIQENEIRKYCENNDICIKNIFVDAGISGANEDEETEVDISKRTGFLDMLEALDEDKDNVHKIIVHKTSRLWRDEDTHIFVVRELKKRKIKIYSISEPLFDLYTTDPSAVLFNTIIAALDVYERMMINVKLARGREVKVRKDRTKPCGEVPFGYKYDENKQVIIEDTEAVVVKKIFNMACSGSGYQGIATWLNDNKYKTRRNNEWSRQAVRSILKNDFYISVISYNDKLWGSQGAIIDKEDWIKINPDYDFSEIKE